MKKYLIIGSIVIVLLVGGFFLWQFLRVKFANVELILKDDLQVAFLSDVKVSDFIESINGEIVDDKKIDTTKIGEQKIEFEYINDDGIKINYSYNIEVVDVTPPVIWLNSSYNVNVGSTISLVDDILCGDDYDSDPICEVIGEYNMNEEGSYDLVFKATDSSGNVTEQEFTLNVREPSAGGSSSNSSRTRTDFADVIREYKSESTEIGIDVSHWQGDINFDALKEAGVEFIIIRVGTADGIDGDYVLDRKFIQNIEGANKVGIPVGIYFYSYADTKERAVADANWILEQIEGYDVDLPIAFDWENWSFYNDFNLSFFGLTDMANSFLSVFEDAGYEGMLYSSKNYLERIWLDTNYPIWLAHYTSQTNYEGDFDFWQLCNNGRVDGIDGDVDINIRYLSTE